MADVDLDDIEDVNSYDLSDRRLEMLEGGHDSFDDVLNSWSDPITLDRRGGPPYTIIDGRHRIYIARERGYSSVPAKFI
jgi:hypothetical protein